MFIARSHEGISVANIDAVSGLMDANSFASYCVIVVPCYNEVKRLKSEVFLQFLRDYPNIDFIFINDGSTDWTADLLEWMRRKSPGRIRVHHLPRNSGKAEAVRAGLRLASAGPARLVGYWDADLATPLDSIPEFIRVTQRFPDVEVVFGSRRRLLGHRVQRTLFRRIVSRSCALLARLAVGLPVGDTQCGAKLMRNTPRLQKALQTGFTAGWLFDVELFARIAEQTSNHHGAFFELPLSEWTEITGSSVTMSAILKSGLHMLRLIALRICHISLCGRGGR